MSAFPQPGLSPFAVDVANGLLSDPKHLDPRYLYDDIGLSLFDTLTRLPEFGEALAEDRIIRRHASELSALVPSVNLVGKLRSGGTRSAAHIVRNLSAEKPHLQYRPLYQAFSPFEAGHEAPGPSDWLAGVARFVTSRADQGPLLLLLLGQSFGSLDAAARISFLASLNALLKPGDFFLVAADLVKDTGKMVTAYQDPIGLAAAFHKNLLTRINRELGGHFNVRQFQHKAVWNAFLHRIELHLEASQPQEVYISSLGSRYPFRAGESIHTESAYKLTELELENLAPAAGFKLVQTWIDLEWAFAHSLWTV